VYSVCYIEESDNCCFCDENVLLTVNFFCHNQLLVSNSRVNAFPSHNSFLLCFLVYFLLFVSNLVTCTSTGDSLQRHVSEMTYYVSSGT